MNPILHYEFGKSRKKFESTWNTANTSAGSSTSTQVKLPLVSTGVYAMRVDWGDGNSDNITVWNAAATTHTYSVSGTYTIKITGVCNGWQFNNTGDRLKILSIATWGVLKLTTAAVGHFLGCSNLVLSSVSDIIDLSATTSLQNTFRLCTSITTINRIGEWNLSTITTLQATFLSCTSFNQSLSSWTTTSITNMVQTFQSCTLFNQNLGSWNTSNVTNMLGMFRACTAFNNGGSNTINNWDVSKVTAFGQSGSVTDGMFASCTSFNQPLNLWNTALCLDMSAMFFNAIIFNQNIGSWNVTKVTDFRSMFQSATVFNNNGSSTIGGWVLNSTTSVNCSNMFNLARAFDQNIGAWNTIKVTSMASMFAGSAGQTMIFNNGGSSTIDSWNTSAVTAMNNMFDFCSSFNQPLNSWNVGLVTSMAGMFRSCLVFNQPLNSWNTINVTAMSSLFNTAVSFNQNIGSWNVTKVTLFSSMFLGATAFNNGGSSAIGGWTLNSTTSVNCNAMFQSCTAFNQNIGAWNTIKITDMTSMFGSATAFNNGGSNTINNWDVSSVTTMFSMFASCTNFNQPISNWVVTACLSFNTMFSAAVSYNQSMSLWNTINATNMGQMFINATAFNQNIGTWDVRNVTVFTNFMAGKTPATFSTANLDAIYNGWSALPSVKPSIVISFGTAKHTAGSTAGRAILTGAPNNWAITDGGI